ncbi:hypothetical protein BU23DRAFT_558067 [Bimuria novae-zelandiae CBS 107.79]|uniref:FR47-like domain-containing protein n=1 Tax=Bimuria novae-zelandiae CBS 107.79 TaxID=1447943 RepID=A0A6A5V6T0_9PLEO|nr:hypothetical protein BU23DRAFT_558067 [Bimuria novae-zelandiae CBS 107.79]
MKIYAHDPSPALQSALKATLPHSIALAYRIQHPNRTPDAHILATFPASTSEGEVPRCWAAAYLDRSMRPETELWIFTPGEIPSHHESSEKEQRSIFCPDCKIAVLALTDYMSTLPIPPLHPENFPAVDLARQHERDFPHPGTDGRYPSGPGLYMRHLLQEHVISLGGCHVGVVQILSEAGLVCTEYAEHGTDLNKFWFRVADLPPARDLPKELYWGEMREEDLAIVQARTPIPRTTKTLLSLKSVGVFERENGRPVASTFLGLDGSLTALHTEPEWRGKGIAKAVAIRILREHAPALAVDEKGNAWAHADVYVGNVQSESVCRSLGGKAGARILWVRIDLGKAGSLAM